MGKGIYARVIVTCVAMIAGLFGVAHAVGPRSLDFLSREQGILLADHSAFLIDISTERTSDVAGSLLGWHEYGPFGMCGICADSGSGAAGDGLYIYGESRIGNAIRYGGYVWDDEIGVYHTRHRKYHPQTQRWLQRDPEGYIDGQNLYAYVRDNPNAYIDPMGKCIPLVVVVGAGGAIGDAIVASGITIAIYLAVEQHAERVRTKRCPADTGDCTEEQYRMLLGQQRDACAKPYSCKTAASCTEIKTLYANAFACKRSRFNVMQTCFNGGDKNHWDHIVGILQTMSGCGMKWRELGCVGEINEYVP